MSENTNLLDKVISLCKRRGFVYPGSEIYGGLANSWDYGPLGATLKNNLKQAWRRRFIQRRRDMVEIDAALIMNPRVWEASGHVGHFSDPLVEDKKTNQRYRLDHLLEAANVSVAGMDFATMSAKMKELKLTSPEGNELTEPRQFNMMLKTFLGPSEDSAATAYLRPETAQAMFVDFKIALQTTRRKLPFGIAQLGKVFRNEITPGNFIFRTREFEQMEIEYFIHPKDWATQFEYWLGEMKTWLIEDLGADITHFNFHEIEDGERAHYSARTVDIEYQYPFGLKELYGLAYRGDYDLKNHQAASKEDLTYLDPETNERYLPHVIEPTFGVDRSILVTLLEVYREEKLPAKDGDANGDTEDTRIVLRLPKKLAPVSVAILPLSKKPELQTQATEVWNLLSPIWACEYDETQSIGKRYRRQDEIGTPYCVTVDFDTLNDQAVTVRDRDTMTQDRVKLGDLVAYLTERFN